jgi:hypothetical protein
MTPNMPPTNITMKIRFAPLTIPAGIAVNIETTLAARAGFSLGVGGRRGQQGRQAVHLRQDMVGAR